MGRVVLVAGQTRGMESLNLSPGSARFMTDDGAPGVVEERPSKTRSPTSEQTVGGKGRCHGDKGGNGQGKAGTARKERRLGDRQPLITQRDIFLGLERDRLGGGKAGTLTRYRLGRKRAEVRSPRGASEQVVRCRLEGRFHRRSKVISGCP